MTRHRGKRAERSKTSCKADQQYRYRLVRLLLCFALFLAVYVGKRAWPTQAAEAGRRMLAVIRSDTDFRAAFSSLGQALSGQESVLGELGEFCVSVFGVSQEERAEPAAVPADAVLPQTDGEEGAAQELLPDTPPEPEAVPEAETEAEAQTQPSALRVGDVVQAVAVSDPPLPEQYSEQWLYLGDAETVTPVFGRITSGFGYRDHPTIGRYAAHGGVDIGADAGAAVACFADGTVEMTGENGDFGKFIQIDHGNGVVTFYAHCRKLCVKQGERVTVGQKIAEVGATGKATGPHLHFEIWLNGTRLDPLHYIENAAQ